MNDHGVINTRIHVLITLRTIALFDTKLGGTNDCRNHFITKLNKNYEPG